MGIHNDKAAVCRLKTSEERGLKVSISMRISLLTFVLTVSLVGPVSAEFPVGDLNGDCDVNSLDLKIFVEQWLDPSGCSGHPDDCADFDSVNGI
ncbi:MAG: hypothetical protein ACYSWZ_16455, partial [Planctomycetota bacterium]